MFLFLRAIKLRVTMNNLNVKNIYMYVYIYIYIIYIHNQFTKVHLSLTSDYEFM